MSTETEGRGGKVLKGIAVTVRVLLLILVVIAVQSSMAQRVDAYTGPYRLLAFTDKQVYLDYAYQWDYTISTGSPATPQGAFEQKINLFVVLLDSDGNIVRGLSSSNFSAAMRDAERWNHSGPGLASYPFYTVEPTNGLYYKNESFPVFSDADGDGIFNSTKTNNHTLTFQSPNVTLPLNAQLNISINITLNYNGTTYKTNVSVIFGNQGCRGGHNKNAIDAHNQSAHDGVVCTLCHWGYQYALGVHGPNNTVMKNDPERWRGVPGLNGGATSSTWDYRTGLDGASVNTTWDNSDASFCILCHGGTTTTTTAYVIGDVLADFTGSPSVADQNNDNLSDNNRVSCSWYRGPRNGTGGYPVCHGPQSGLNGSTNITGSKLFKVDWNSWTQQKPGQSKSHNHSVAPNTNGMPCELCHAGGGASGTGTGGMHQVVGLPNRTTTDYTDINTQCWLCHNITGGLNITSNGGTNVDHADTNCKQCHMNATGALDAHLVPKGTSGGVNCTSCHYIGSQYRNINVTAVNLSVHSRMNIKNATNASVPSVNGACWACHDSDGNVSNNPDTELMGDIYDTPKICTDCHLGTGTYNTSAYKAIVVSEHYYNGTVIKAGNSTSNITSCINCHENVSEMLLYNNDTDTGTFAGDGVGATGGNTSYYHYGRPRRDMRTGTSENCLYCHQNYSTAFTNAMQKPDVSRYVYNHTNSILTLQKCITCHGSSGWIHNSTLKKDPLSNGYCMTCHSSQLGDARIIPDTHNSAEVNCWNCHQDPNGTMYQAPVHGMMYAQANGSYLRYDKGTPANCTTCHIYNLVNTSTNYATVVPLLSHSTDPYSGMKWDGYWDNTSAVTACYYCHQSEVHQIEPALLGNISAYVQGTISPNIYNNPDLASSTWCANCHYAGAQDYGGASLSPVPPEITNSGLVSSDGTAFYNHLNDVASNYTDAKCGECHGAVLSGYSKTTLNFSHSVSEVAVGPNCIDCHGYGGTARHRINNSVMNASNAIHARLNQNASNASWVSGENKKCWGCHDETGTEPPNGSMGSRYDNPYKCYDCHNATEKPYENVSNALNVTEHFKSGEIKAAINASDNSSSCLVCHNQSEMKLAYTEDDIYNSNYSLVSHYGRNRTDLRTWNSNNTINCSYCHQNSTTAFADAMLNPTYNRSIQNHSGLSTSPACYNSTCHGSGWLHNSTLTRPVLPLPNTAYCQNCHAVRQKHNGTQDCSNCHINTTSSDTIHPVKYIQTTGSFATTNATAANCTDCHQGTLTGFGQAPVIPNPLKHSFKLSNGSIWGAYWSGSNSSCYYCHGDTKHNATALGRIGTLMGDSNNTRNGPMAATTWCADCHYNDSANAYYNGSLWSPAPPLITANNTGKSNWINHTRYIAGGYKDSNCSPCHALNGSYPATSLNYSHSLDEGVAGGPNCINCHDYGSSNAQHRINNSVMNSSSAIHRSLNSNAANSSWVSSENKKCWGCHDATGAEPPNGSMGSRYDNPYKCYDCHNATAKPYNSISTALNVTEHFKSGEIKAAVNASDNSSSCLVCHNQSEMKLSYTEDDLYNSNYSLVSHYGRNRADLRSWNSSSAVNCSYCHQNSTTAFTDAMLVPSYNKSILNHSGQRASPTCYNSTCHGSGWIHNSTLARPVLPLPNTKYCQNCHAAKQKHNNTIDCSSCHVNSTSNDTIHPIKYIQVTGSFETANISAANCTNCHQGSVTGFGTAPQIPAPLRHSSNLSNGSIWNTYWDGSSSSCYYCHGDTKHNSTALGKISTLLNDSNNSRNRSIATTTWCADCHYNASANAYYNGSKWNPVPPLVTINNTGKSNWVNHTSYIAGGYKDSNCQPCHILNGSYLVTLLNYSHSLDEGKAGGPNCISCHDYGSSGAQHRVNNSIMNASSAIHRNLNLNAVNSIWVSSENKKCWGCHDATGAEPPNGSMGSRYDNPYKCYDCHNATAKPYANVSAALNVSEHFKSGDIKAAVNASDNSSSCLVCHNQSEMKLSYTEDDIYNSNYSFVSHYGRNRTDLRTWNSSNTINCSYCHQNSTTAFADAMLNPTYNRSILNHSNYSSTPACYNSTCHSSGWIHNSTLTKPALPNTAYCQNCHATRQKHNGTQDCSNCHINSTSNDTIHPIKYIQTTGLFTATNTSAANCTSCHQSTLTGFEQAPVIPNPLRHSSNLSNGSIWGTYWSGSSSSCYYCHGDTKHSSMALGKISALLNDSNNTRNGSITTTTWCADCHYNASANTYYNGSKWNPVPPLITANNTGKNTWVNHTSYIAGRYKDSNCLPCHVLNSSYPSIPLNYSHSLDEGKAGGPNCISCHDYGSSGAGHKINNSIMNSTSAIHRNLNSNASNSSWVSGENKKCWGCHDATGTEPSNGSMGSRYDNPYKCYDCHNATSKPYENVRGALNVTEHFKSGEIKAAANASDNSSSCLVCHNQSEMKLSFTEDDTYSSNYSLVSHYGRSRAELRTWNSSSTVNCSYCHQNSTTAFENAMLNPTYNKSIQNHSSLSTSPACYNSTCHGSGWLHNSTLARPALPLPNTTYCSTCHTSKQKHKGTQDCSNCHINSTSSYTIHPIKYIQTTGLFAASNASAANCTDCHQSALNGFSSAPQIPDPLKHSSNISNGSIWNSTSTAYWITSNGSCYYCHGDTKHNATALGKISSLLNDVNNIKNGSLTATKWCADCHYNGSTNTNYSGDQWNPIPPLIAINNTGKSNWINHTSYIAGGYKDSNCLPCHALNSSYSSTSLNYSHSLDGGKAGGPNCISCHDYGSSGAGHRINNSVMNLSSSIHKNLNSNASNSSWVSGENKKCWGCHDATGTEPPNGSMGSRYDNPYKCYDCHNATAKPYANVSSALNVSEHFKGGEIKAAINASDNSSSCLICHNRSEMKLSYTEDDIYNSNYSVVSHYGKNRTELRTWDSNSAVNCSYCHQNSSTAFADAMLNSEYNRSIQNHSGLSTSPACYNSTCHGSGWLHNSTLTKPVLPLPNATYCQNCHAAKQKHNNTQDCTNCHINSTSNDIIHPIKYIQATGSFTTSSTPAANCTSCHQSTLTGFEQAPVIPNPLRHSSNLSNGSIWGTYWSGSSSSCYYCHGDTKHNSMASGKISALLNDSNNTRNGSITTTTWCADCHYNGSINTYYSGSIWNPVPPLITVNNTGKSNWINHTSYIAGGYKDSNCLPCHSLNGSYLAISLNYSHSLDEGAAGGPNCISCHDYGSSGAGHRINNSIMNTSSAIHRGLNSNAANSSWVSSENKKCWGCHDVTGAEPPNGSMGSRYDNPYKCYDCHNATGKPYPNVSSALNVTEHFKDGEIKAAVSAPSDSSSCLVCHNQSEMKLSYTEDDIYNSNYSLVSHYGRNRTDLRTWNSSNAINCSYCHQNTSTAFAGAMQNPGYNSSILNHSTYISTPACTNSTCHGSGWLHNSTLARPALPLPNTAYCSTCHTSKQKHNGTQDCSNCHINATSNDTIHPIKYIQATGSFTTSSTPAANCTSCHQSTLTGFEQAPVIPNPLRHSSNLSNGSIWGTYWSGSSSSCYYCHGDTKHNATALGKINTLLNDPNNTRNGSITSTTWCADCHYNDSINAYYSGSKLNPIPPLITINNTGKSNWVNHSTYLGSGYRDSNCKTCHALSYPATSQNYSHSLDEGSMGGRDCVGCHDEGKSVPKVDVSSMNRTNSIHAYLNSNASATLNPDNKRCWACHSNSSTAADGVVNEAELPATGHPDKFDAPRRCKDCHIDNNFGALTVSEHYSGSLDIRTKPYAAVNDSCVNCHNKSEMIIPNSDPGGPKSEYANVSHYGDNKTGVPLYVSGSSANCSYCHQNTTSAFRTEMNDAVLNSSISNHTALSTSPGCTNSTCHGSGRIHFSTLARPAVNSTLCAACHATQSRHNGTVECSGCHLETNRSIHPIQYLQPDESWKSNSAANKSSAVNCTDCHQAGLSNFSAAPRIPNTLKHSSNLTNGSLWNGTRYWTSSNSSCYYCHSNTKHSATALGRMSSLLGDVNNSKNGSLAATKWCADCHYNTNANYSGDQWSPVPPLITVNNTNNPGWTNHSTYLGSGYKDANCLACHALNGSYLPTSLNYSHSLNGGVAGGPNCVACHDTGGTAGAGRLVNFSAMNGSNAIHRNLNSGAATGLSAENKKCWACHGNGSEPAGSHPPNYRTPYRCTDCHVPGPGQNMNFTPASLLNVTQHYWNGTSISTAASCYDCHNRTEMMLGSFDPDGAAGVYGGENGGNNSASHYGRKRSDYPPEGTNDYCYRCHGNASSAFPFTDTRNKEISNHSSNYPSTNPACANCHAAGRIHNSTLYKPVFSLPNSTYCTACHAAKERHNGTLNCTECHLNSTRSIHPVRYLGQGTWSTTNTTAINCTNCHQSIASGFTNAPIIPELKHSTDPSSGRKWGNYWDNSSIITACYYCHQSEIHKANGLAGNVSLIKGENTYGNSDLANSTWCANCHYAGAPQYNGSALVPPPPEITNSSLNASDGTSFFNHSGFTSYNDSTCKHCHGGALSGYAETTLNFSHSISEGGGGPNCTGCHDVSGTGAPADKRITVSSVRLGVHRELNSNAPSSASVDPLNKACWACHGDGKEPSGHPLNYSNPRRCGDCHTLSQSYGAPMVYSHFKGAELNSNPEGATNYNISTALSCESCHYNSVGAGVGNTNASVSHYATRENLVDSRNCLYCHLDRDNSIKWGYATEINENRTALVEMNREKREVNKFTARAGEFVELGQGYRLKVTDISKQRGSAAIELYKSDQLVDSGLINGGQYVYEEMRSVNGAVIKFPVIVLNVTAMFLSDDGGFMQFEGWRVKRVHPENKTTSCYLCHYSGGDEKHRYTVLERKENDVFYTEVLLNSSDRKEYDQKEALQVLARNTPKDAYADTGISGQKILEQGVRWEIGKNYNFTLKDAATDSASALLLLEVGNMTYTGAVRKGDTFNYELRLNYPGYTDKNITVFRAKVSEIHQGQPSIVILENIVALSPEIKVVKDDTIIYGYNTSWMRENDTFTTGRIPASLHAPLLHDGREGGPDCTSCHLQIELGAHRLINEGASSGVAAENKPCWACHGDGKEPKTHPGSYKNPRECKSCHAEGGMNFNATYIGGEKHSAAGDCRICHVEESHRIIRFNVVPGIKTLSISKAEVYTGEKVRVNATAVAGFNMSVKGAEYYVDSPASTFAMSALDGSFDEQVEELTAEIDTSGLRPGVHSIYVKAMERGNRWGVENSIPVSVKEKQPSAIERITEKIPDVSGFVLVLVMFALYVRRKKLQL